MTPREVFLSCDVDDQEYWFREGCYIAELSNGADDEAVSIARARVLKNGVTRWHRLSGTTERYVIIKGHGRAEVGDQARTVAAGDVVIIPPDVPQRIVNEGREDLVFLAICTPRFRPENYQDLEADEAQQD